MDLFSRRSRAAVLAVSRTDGLIGTLERGPDLIAPLDAHLFRIIETPRVGRTTAVSYVSSKNRSMMYLCATKYDKPSGAYGLNDSNPCPSSASTRCADRCVPQLLARTGRHRLLGQQRDWVVNIFILIFRAGDAHEPRPRWRIRCHSRMPCETRFRRLFPIIL